MKKQLGKDFRPSHTLVKGARYISREGRRLRSPGVMVCVPRINNLQDYAEGYDIHGMTYHAEKKDFAQLL